MGLPIARHNDTVLGTCYNHGRSITGHIIAGATKSKINNLNIAQLTNSVIFD
jgi:hypothetical protein